MAILQHSSYCRYLFGFGLILTVLTEWSTATAKKDDWSFTSNHYTGNIKECAVACDKLYVSTSERMGIRLPSRDRVENIKYRITKLSKDVDSNNQFKTEVLTIGDFAFLFIRTKTDGSANLNREWKSYYSLSIRAVITFTDGEVTDATTRVDINVLDVNDALPLFVERSYELEVPESAEIFSTVGSVKATDADEGFNAEIYYSFEDPLPEFAVHPTSGDIYITRNLSTSGRRHYGTNVIAANRVGGRQSNAPISFKIIQRNEHSPEFIVSDRPPINAFTPTGTTILLIKVVDLDSGLNGKIQTLEILSVVGSLVREAESYFVLEPTVLTLSKVHAPEYQLKVKRSLKDIGNQVNITLQAWDNGSPVRSTRNTLTLDILVFNKEHSGEETVHLEIDEGLPAGTPLHYMAPPHEAIDATYRIARDDLDAFEVHSTSGVLFLKRKIDAEKDYQATVEVRLRAKLSLLERSEYAVTYVITIRDENDNSPVFATPIERPLREDSSAGTLVTIASATDEDAGDNALINYSLGDSDMPFEIDPFSGEIRLIGSIDYDAGLRLYHIPVRASDRGTPFRRETEKIFTVSIENVNDNKPMFEYSKCDVRIAKDTPIGSQISKVTALDIDMDLNRLTYTLNPPDSAASLVDINRVTGVITTSRDLAPFVDRLLRYQAIASDGRNVADPVVINVRVLDYVTDTVQVSCTDTDARRIYDATIRASAQKNPSHQEIILPATSEYLSNDHSPVFDHLAATMTTQYSLPEDLPIGSIVTHITATDEDSGYAGLVQYHLEHGNSRGHFAVNGSTGALLVFASLDREMIPMYNLTIVATDSAEGNRRSSSVNIMLTVLDANDNTPQFLGESYFEAYVTEAAKSGTVVLQVLARDDDSGSNGRVAYTLLTDTPYFRIDTQSGKIRVSGELDRESKDRHILEVKAADMPDGPEEVRFSTTTVIIHITDVNDNEPTFMKSEYRVKVREDMPIGTVITNLVAQDPDLPATGGEVTYRIIKGRRRGRKASNGAGEDNVFSLDKNTGIVKLMSKLDYEYKALYHLTIRARDNGTNPLKSTCVLRIDVIDVNENLNRPVFGELAYDGRVSESAPLGSVVMQINASDADEAVSDHRIAYTIRRGSGLGSFTIDNLGYIKTAMVLDRESQPSYWLTVYAQDHGTVPLSSSVDVYIEVEDVNDNAPEASQPVFYVSVTENNPPNHPITSITATDRDGSSDITYSITGGNTQSLFSIGENTGVIQTTRRALDRESNEKHTLEVTISDGGVPVSLSSSIQVWITVEDENDNVPTWNVHEKLSIPLLRSHERRRPVYRIIASDRDKAENGTVSYSIPDNADRALWRIDSLTGDIYLKADWPEASQVILKVKATDAGFAPKVNFLDIEFVLAGGLTVESSDSPVLVDRVPVFVMETANVFDYVEVITAKDNDSSKIWYSIVDGAFFEGFPVFSIQPTNGLVEVAGKLDYEKKSKYLLNISATDGQHTAYTILPVNLINVNEFQPQFDKRLYEVTVKEDVEVGNEVVTLTATDGDNDSLIYVIHSVTDSDSHRLFEVDHKTGVISTLQPLDHESNHLHELIVRVNDNGLVEFSDYVKLVIHVEDYNDHVPKFVTDVLTANVYEMSVIGTSVTQVQATDRDKGDNSRIQYSLLSGNVGYTFNVDPELGIISLVRTLDRSVRAQYELTIMANDMGTPSLSSTCLVKVRVTVASERPPSFESTFFTAELKENEPIGAFVIALNGESQSTLTYDIVETDEPSEFSINPNSGILTSNRVFDYEERSLYNVSLSATDIIGHQVSLVVVVHIIDKNDNRPVFKQLTYRGHVSEGSPDGSVVLTEDSVPLMLTAKDKDSNLNALVLYTIIESEARRYFMVDANTGAIRTVRTPDREIKSQYEFTVQVRDQGEESLSAANPARVIITVDDINDTPPTFIESTSEVTLLAPTYKGVTVHAAVALDADLATELKYEIFSGNADGKFAIDEFSGSVYVNNPDGLRNSYSLVVKVSDGVHETEKSLAVNVQQTGGSGLVFTESHYTGKVIENRTTPQTLLIVLPVSLELGEPISFELLNHEETFKIGETSGVLATRAGAVIDREVNKWYLVIVRVQTGGRNHRLAQVPVNITVIDINDNAPYFTKEQYYATATVSTARGVAIAKIIALDKDDGDNSEIRYSMINVDQNNFKINRKTGEVTAKRQLVDYANHEYIFTVIAEDQGEPALSSQTTLTVKVYAASTPNFTQIVYECSIPENIPISSAVTTVSAESPNSNKIIYTIAEGDPNSEFTVHFSTAMDSNGPCTVRVNDDLDFDLRPRYKLKVRAVDVVTGDWSDAIVIINVQDVNDQKPYFDKLDYYKSVSEAVTVGSEVLTINASDADQGINSQIHYSLKSLGGNGPSQPHQMFEVKEDEDGIARICTVSAFDHEEHKSLDFIIVATDGGNPRQSAEAYIHILVTDLNDNPPIFDQSAYFVKISDEVKKGQFVAMVAAVDVDDCNEGKLMYNIVHGNDGQAFAINQESGSIYVSPFNQNSVFNDAYLLNISVSDGIFTSFTSLSVTVIPANRHGPEFLSILYNFKVFENSTDEMVVGQVRATDMDEGLYGEITYSLIGGWLLDHFTVHPNTGEIILKHTLDREERDFYMLPIMAQDAGGLLTFTNVYVVVEDINDHAPEFLSTGYSAAVLKNATRNSDVLTVSAFDLDKQKNAEIVYTILSDTTEIKRTFTIDSVTGRVRLARGLTSSDTDKEFTFFVRASDNGNTPLDSTVLVTVTVSTDFLPVFPTTNLQIFLHEIEEIGTEVAIMKAEYSGEHQLSYRIRSGASVRTNQPTSFVIDSRGRITTVTSLDRESQGVFELVVEAFTVSVRELVASTVVIVSPIDSNDNSPQFTSDIYSVSVAENIPIGASIVQVSAYDMDQDHSTNVMYSFAPESKTFDNLFMIEPNHGWITTLVQLDREQRSSYEFYVQASDEDARGKLSSKAKVKVELLDVNDCPPRFPSAVIIGGVRYWNATAAAVNEDALIGTVVVQIKAVDDDLPRHSTNMYYISGGNNLGHFRIKQTGEIFVSKSLDRESRSEYHLEVSATDGVFVTSIMVQITLLDANDNPPVCERPLYTRVLSEDVNTGTLVLAMKASDRDEPGSANSRITYSLLGEGSDHFAIDNIRGDIRVHRRLDREKISTYHITGVATDGPGLRCVTDIEFELVDVNDNSPVFDQSVYAHTLPEDSTNNTLLLRVTATDKDAGSNRKVDYSMLSGSSDMFAIDPNNGIVRLIKPLREEGQDMTKLIGQSYSVIIAATDRGELRRTGTAELQVRISDVNDPPVFQNSLYNKSVSEDVGIGTALLQVKAISMDKGQNNVIRYRISNGGANHELFAIDSITGILTTSGRFDYELVREYVLNVEAKDGGEPPLSDMCMVTVYITDANDNKPTFSQATYSVSIREDAKIGDQVIRIHAQDLDADLNAEIIYSIIAGDDLNQFSINKDGGYVHVGAPLDREQISTYRLTVEASDKGMPDRQSASVIILISVTDINDNPPLFSQANYTAQVQVYPEGSLYRNTTFLLTTLPTSPAITTGNVNGTPMFSKEGHGVGYSPLTLTVIDADVYPNSVPFKYEILSGDSANQFSISETGQLLAHGFFDMKVRKEYLLQVKVEDSGVPPLSSTAYIRLEVHEAILHPPKIVSPRNFTVVAYEDTFPGGIIGYVGATDPDFDKLEYKLASPQFRRMFSMDPDTGAFSSYSLDSGTYLLNVSASDSRFIQYGIIEVNVISITDEMMTEAVGVRIDGITASEFVSVHRKSFERALLGLSSDFRRIHILSINEGASTSVPPRHRRQTQNSGVLVLVAAELATWKMTSKQTLASYIRENVATVRSILGGLGVSLPIDSFVCSPSMNCNTDERCDLEYQITQDKVAIHTDEQSFVSLVTQPVERCVCLGPTCVNPCSANPCPRHKTCVSGNSPHSYSCECPAGTFGQDCELHDGSPMAFNGESYTRWTLVNDIKTQLQVNLQFRTKQSNAILMDARGDRDYSTLEIVDGLLQYSFECGSGPAVMRTAVKVNDGNWHNVTLERKRKIARFVLDGKYSAQGQSDRGTEEINLVDKNIYFGAMSSKSDIILAGFKGCIKGIHIDQVPLPYTNANSVGGDAQFHNVLFECHECSINPCQNGGTCIQTGAGVICSCKGFDGPLCENDVDECQIDTPCSAGSTCQNTKGSFTCQCAYGKAGSTCHQKDECLSNPCADNNRCLNVDLADGLEAYKCECAGVGCEVAIQNPVSEGGLTVIQIVYVSAGGLGFLIFIVLIAVVAKCVSSKRKAKAKLMESTKSERENMYYPRASQDHRQESHELYQLHQRAPSPPPPSVPPRPASYTPSVNENSSKALHRNYDLSHDYGSAADGLDRIGNKSGYPPEYRDVVARTNPPRTTTTFAALPKLSPLPPSVSDTDSIRKPAWDFNYPTNEKSSDMISSGKGSDRPSRTTVIAAVPHQMASRSGSKAGGSRNGSKPASITNGSFTSIPQEDEGYHWDTSDWVPMREDGHIPDFRDRRVDGSYVGAAKLLSMSEVDDSEYVEDSELDDDVIPQISGPSYNHADEILALQAQYKLDYDLEIHVPKPDRNHYLPSHGISNLERRNLEEQSLLARGASSPAVPQRSVSLSYSTDDITCATADEIAALGEGYTSMEAGDSQSELSENICDIESDCEADMEGILSRVKHKNTSSEV